MGNNDILVSLDIGTSEVKVIVGEVMDDSLNIIGVGTDKSNGLRKGAIVDIDETVRAIKKAVENAEHMVDMSIENVVVAVNANHVQLHPCHGVVAVQSENREIGDEDITRVIEGAQVMSIPPEREIIDVIPKQFIVDGFDEINDPRGMIGVRLEMEGTIITTTKTVLHNVLRCVEKAGLHIVDVVLQPLASGAIALSKDERNLGVALIDVGGGCTTVSVFEDDFLVASSVIPLGGENITKDLSIGLRTSTEEAEEIKVNYGHGFYETANENETVDVSIIGSNEKKTFNQLEISDMIEARLEEIYELTIRELRRMGYNELRGGYVLTGGTLKMPGALELAQIVFQSNARIAIPDYIGVREPQYTVGIGTIQFAHQNAKVQGKELESSVSENEAMMKQQTKLQPNKMQQRQQREDYDEEPKTSKVASFLKSFFE
ncbi:MAG TPA: cell division protein FtsA [Pseudogracilibacillus sp.]|nr:cell division protein FtsA [Pseudogracilibacillus sp.]